MVVRLKPGTVIKCTHQSGATWVLDDKIDFVRFVVGETNLYSPVGHAFSGCGFSEDLFDILP